MVRHVDSLNDAAAALASDGPLPDCVAELAWYVVSSSRPIGKRERLHDAKALRRGLDEWVVTTGFMPHEFLHSAGYDLWRWMPPRRHDPDDGWYGAEPQRFTFAQVCSLVPRVLIDEVKFPGGQFAHINDLVVVAGHVGGPEVEYAVGYGWPDG